MGIKDRLDEEQEQVPGWKPDAGDEIIGTILRVSERKQDDYEPYPVYTVRGMDGNKIAVHAFHFVLRQQLEEDNAQPGDEVGIRYLGQVTEDVDRAYHNYRTVVEKTSAQGSTPSASSGLPIPQGTTSDPSDPGPQPPEDEGDIPF